MTARHGSVGVELVGVEGAGDADHAVAGDQGCELRFRPAFGAFGSLGDDQETEIGGAVVNPDLDLVSWVTTEPHSTPTTPIDKGIRKIRFSTT